MMTKHIRNFSRLWLLCLLTVLLGVVASSTTASAANSSATTTTRFLQQEGIVIPRTKPSSLLAHHHHHPLDKTLPAVQQNKEERRLPGYYDIDVSESIHNLFSTPPEAWTAGQWILAIFMILLTLWCCGGCLACGRRRRYHREGYYSSSHNTGGGICGCLRNVFLCACCFEWCCRDCQDVPFCNSSGAGGEYYRQTGDVV